MTDGSDYEPRYGVEVCLRCDSVRPEYIGSEVDCACPDCGGQLFGLLGTEIIDWS